MNPLQEFDTLPKLTSKDFNYSWFSKGNMKGSITGFVMLWASWCGHCTTFKPKYVALSKEFPKINFSTMEDKDSILFRKNVEIKGFPTVLIYKNNKLVGYHQHGTNLYDIAKEL